MTAASWLAIITAIAVAALIGADRVGSRAGVWIAKPIASAGFVATGLASRASASAPGRAMLLALILAFIGDVLLIPRHNRAAFRAGLASFLLGHVAFSAAFLMRGVAPLGAGTALALLIPIAIRVLRWLRPHVPRELAAPVLAYVAMITLMVALAAGSLTAPRGPALLVAAILFFLSDLSVARDRFVAPGFPNRAWGLPLYYGAQLLFATNAAELR